LNLKDIHTKLPLKWWLGLTALVVLVILVVGLKPGDFSSPNHAEWIGDRQGLRFQTSGIAYTDSISDLIHNQVLPDRSFSIEIALQAKSFSEDGFQFVLLVHGGSDNDQLLIGQWRSSLIVMNGDDYAHRRKTERITVTSATETPRPLFVTITVGDDGTGVFLDGQPVAMKKEMRIELPEGRNTRLLIGNSVYGKHPWQGEVYGLAVYGKTLSREAVAAHYAGWSNNLDFSFARGSAPVLLYRLDGSGVNLAADPAGAAHALQVPPRLKVLIPGFFYQKLNIRRFGESLFKDPDAVINFIGFIPLGLLLVATLMKIGGRLKTRSIPISLAAGFLMSLGIETVQAWMPARSSDLQDLILNTAGTWVGALCCKYLLLGRRGTKLGNEAQRHKGTKAQS
jgi:VanZ family protein